MICLLRWLEITEQGQVCTVSKYTTEVRYICESYSGLEESVGYKHVEEVLDASWEKIFDFDFPIFDENYKPLLCKKILLHYYTREIGFETVGLWQLKLRTKMNEIMPKFNALYKALMDESYEIKINPLNFVDYYKAHSGGNNGEHSTQTVNGGRGKSKAHNVNKYNDTPQGRLADVEQGYYLTSASVDDNSSENTYGSGSNVEHAYEDFNNFLEHVFGKMPGESYAKVINDWANNFRDVDMMIINSLNDLFMLVW